MGRHGTGSCWILGATAGHDPADALLLKTAELSGCRESRKPASRSIECHRDIVQLHGFKSGM
jgi:hypothetical protein